MSLLLVTLYIAFLTFLSQQIVVLFFYMQLFLTHLCILSSLWWNRHQSRLMLKIFHPTLQLMPFRTRFRYSQIDVHEHGLIGPLARFLAVMKALPRSPTIYVTPSMTISSISDPDVTSKIYLQMWRPSQTTKVKPAVPLHRIVTRLSNRSASTYAKDQPTELCRDSF